MTTRASRAFVLLFVLVPASAMPAQTSSQHRAAPAVNAPVTIAVDAAASRHAIDPRIYGAAFASPAAMADLGITINRWGGNAMSRYNWVYSTANRCKDWYFENVPDSVAGDGSNGESADDFIGPTLNGGAQAIITIPMMGLLPKDRSYRCGYSVALYGAQQSTDQWNPDCGNGKDTNGNRMLGVNATTDTSASYTSAHQANWVQHLVTTWGGANAGGVKYYAYDNEPVLWSFDHWDIHPTGSTYNEVWSKWIDYGPAIKAKDPNALLLGPDEWGWSGYFDSGIDAENNNASDRNAHGGVGFSEWLLQQAKAYEQAHGQRILDVFTLHYYPQGGEFGGNAELTDATKARRNRSTRSLWDPAYVDESWIGGTGINGGIVRLIPLMKQWVASNYPGTLVGLTEYNWGADNDINGGTAQADILGILGREGADLAVRWTTPPNASFTYNAFKIYRNYDGNHSAFGDTSVSASGTNVDEIAPFAALRSSDGALTLMIVTKTFSGSTSATVNLSNFVPLRGTTAKAWRLDSGNAITQIADVPLSGTSLSLTLPQQSITLLIIAGAKVPQAPVIGAATPGNGSASVAFTPPGDDGGNSITSYTATCNPGGHTGNNNASPVSVGGLTNGATYNCSVTATNAVGTSVPSGTVSVTAGAFGTPAGFSATALDTTNVRLTWTPVAGASSYDIERSSANSGFNPLVSVGAPPYTDPGLTPQTTYLYRVRAVGGSGTSAFTSVDSATTIVFIDDPLVAGATVVAATHINQLRAAVTAMLAAKGLAAPAFTDPVLDAGMPVRAAHVSELRSALDVARGAIGLPTLVYTDPTLTSGVTQLKAVHLTEIREGVK